MNRVEFFVPGVPATAGSKRAFPVKRRDGSIGVNVAHDNPNTKSWMTAVRDAGKCDQFFTGPVTLDLELIFARPKGHFRTNGLLKPGAPHWHTSRPDSTKCLRAIEDALKMVLWRDDSQVMPSVRKRYANAGERCGARVIVIDLLPTRVEHADLLGDAA